MTGNCSQTSRPPVMSSLPPREVVAEEETRVSQHQLSVLRPTPSEENRVKSDGCVSNCVRSRMSGSLDFPTPASPPSSRGFHLPGRRSPIIRSRHWNQTSASCASTIAHSSWQIFLGSCPERTKEKAWVTGSYDTS